MTGVEAACLEETTRTYQSGPSALPPRCWGRFSWKFGAFQESIPSSPAYPHWVGGSSAPALGPF
jgi:hypothetical protein